MTNIVLCADGTWNRPGTDDSADQPSYPTNVFKLFTNLDGKDSAADITAADEQERVATDPTGATTQIAKYLHGVGDSDNILVKLLGGATGAGTIARIVRGYTFLSRNYVPGARIFLIGFSRGAYTVRALAGLVQARGLLDATRLPLATDRGKAYRLGAAVWYDYQHARRASQPQLAWPTRGPSGRLARIYLATPTQELVSPVPIDTVAVWDTVGALGIPDYTSTDAVADLFRFANTTLGPGVSQGFHAVSRDEQRADFIPTLWDPDPPRIKQLLFAGAHGDVGGGYPTTGTESGLSDLTLDWMTGLLTGRGVVFAAKPTFVTDASACGCAHEPWLTPPFNLLPILKRVFPQTLAESPSIQARRDGSPVRPDPSKGPTDYTSRNFQRIPRNHLGPMVDTPLGDLRPQRVSGLNRVNVTANRYHRGPPLPLADSQRRRSAGALMSPRERR
jgi:uncharacterized protein (DUF2235 family)